MNSHDKGPGAPAIDLDQPHVPLAKFRVLYIGRAAPTAILDSLEAIQKPLCELYMKDDRQSRDTDVDAVLTVYTSGLLMAPVNPLDGDLWLPIQTLLSCAAVKAVVENLQQGYCQEKGDLSFVPVDDPKAARSPYPAIFTCVMGRSNGLPLTDCYAFVCQSNDAALLMVQATMHAFSNKRGWACDRPPKLTSAAAQCNDALKITSSGQCDDDTPAEFYERPPLHGFFYTPSPGLIQKFQIQGQECLTTEMPSGGQLRTPYIRDLSIGKPQQPSVMVYGTDQDAIFVDQEVTVADPTLAFPGGRVVQFSDPGQSQSIAFNPYLVPVMDPPPPAPPALISQQPLSARPLTIKQTTTTVGKDPIVKKTNFWGRQDYGPPSRDPAATGKDSVMVVPVAQAKVGSAAPGPHGDQDPIYQKRLPRTNPGVDEAYIGNGRGYTSGGGWDYGPSPVADRTPYGQAPSEDLYSHRLPPPVQDPLPQGARQFDANFILKQSDTDKVRIADVGNYRGNSAPINVADFGF